VLDRVLDPGLESTPLLVLADIEKVLAQEDAVFDDNLPLDRRNYADSGEGGQ
jgi:hypothetical protein